MDEQDTVQAKKKITDTKILTTELVHPYTLDLL